MGCQNRTRRAANAPFGNFVNVGVKDSRSEITASINNFVEAYNELDKNIDSLTSYDAETGSDSVLIGDFTVRSISSQIRNVIFGSISGLTGNIKTLVDIGITTNSSGTLNVHSSKLNDALLEFGPEVEELFSLQGRTTDPGVRYLSSTSDTQSGDYAINTTTVLTQGVLTGTGPVTNLTVDGSNNRLRLMVDGIDTGNLNLTDGTYADEAALASNMQNSINSTSALVTAGVSVTVTYDATADRFVITSDSSGPSSTIEITNDDNDTFADFGLLVGPGIDGTTGIAGTIDGVSASVDGQILTSQSGNSKGISVEILSGGPGDRGAVSVSNGLARTLDDLLDSFLQSDGLIPSREESINESLGDIVDEGFRLDDRLASLEARLIRQFSALDPLIAQAKGAIQHGTVKQKGECIGKAISIIGGLDGCLDHSHEGDLSTNLSALYEYMIISLAQANISDDIAKLNETSDLLLEIKSAWEQIPEYARPTGA